MKVLITGAGGFIGSTLARRLLERGDGVRGLLLPGEPDRGLGAAGMEVVRGDLTDAASLRDIATGCQKVIHTAMRVTDWGSRRAFFSVGVDGSRNLLDECVGRVERFVFLSSIAAYGFRPEHLEGFDEDTPLLKVGLPYGDAKAVVERMLRTEHARGNLEGTVIRPSNVTGPGSVWVRDILDALRRGPVPLIDGGRYSASLVYVENLADGIILALDSPAAAGRAYNLRDDYQVTWKEYITALGGLIGKKPGFPLPFKAAWAAGHAVELACLPFGVRPPLTRTAAGIMGRDNDVSSRRAAGELGWRTRVSWEEAWTAIAAWVREEYLPAR